ncbi:MAG TPA: hypothetical protein VLS90_18420, partial [Thermodesulfobacteriota bacterium]|nr:hypothetical protein [Thermodesulfobacteriota bacterium]
ATIRLAVDEVQGTLRPEEIRLPDVEKTGGPSRITPGFGQIPPRELSIRHEPGTMHSIAFSLMLLNGIVGVIDSFRQISPSLIIIPAVLATIFIITAVCKQNRSDIPAPVRTIAWVSFGYSLLFWCFLWVLVLFTMILTARANVDVNQMDIYYRGMVGFFSKGSPSYKAVLLASTAADFILGGLGLLRMKKRSAASTSLSILDARAKGGPAA